MIDVQEWLMSVCVMVIPPTSSSAISSLYVFSREEYAW
jgi:hypothetical protein